MASDAVIGMDQQVDGQAGSLAQMFVVADSAIERRRCGCAVAPPHWGPQLSRALLKDYNNTMLAGLQDGKHLQAVG